MIKDNTNCYSSSMMCRLLAVSSSGYDEWLSKVPSSRARANLELSRKSKGMFDKEKSGPGGVRITKKLRAAGENVSRQRVARLMRLHGWRARAAKQLKATTNSNHTLPVAPHLLEQNFEASRQNEKFVSDTTYSWTEEGWLYGAVKCRRV